MKSPRLARPRSSTAINKGKCHQNAALPRARTILALTSPDEGRLTRAAGVFNRSASAVAVPPKSVVRGASWAVVFGDVHQTTLVWRKIKGTVVIQPKTRVTDQGPHIKHIE